MIYINLPYYWDKLATMQHVHISHHTLQRNYIIYRIVPGI